MTLAGRIRAASSGEEPTATALTQLTMALIGIPSLTGEERPLAEFLASLLDELGWDGVSVDDHANLVARVRGARPGPRLMFLTHTDTFAPGETAHPFNARVEDGASLGTPGPVIRGLGANTPKGVIASMLVAADRFASQRDRLGGEIILAAVTRDLLANHDGIRDVHAAGIEADFTIAGEPTGNRIALGARGIARYDVAISGTAAHAGSPHRAVNPVPLMARLILDLDSRDWGSHERLGPATMAFIEVMARGSAPLTPETCLVRLDFRPLPGADPDEIDRTLQEAADRTVAGGSATSSVERTQSMFPLGTPENDSFVQIASAALASVRDGRHEPDVISFATNGGYAAGPMGASTFCFGPGDIADIGDRSHVAIQDLVTAERFFAEVSRRVLDVES